MMDTLHWKIYSLYCFALLKIILIFDIFENSIFSGGLVLGLGTWLGDNRERERRTAAVLGLGLIFWVTFFGGNLRGNFGGGPQGRPEGPPKFMSKFPNKKCYPLKKLS